jgi:hypothetical protein
MPLGKRSRSNLYDDIQYPHTIKKFKCSDGSVLYIEPRYIYQANILASTFKCEATTDAGSLLTVTSVSAGSYQYTEPL